MSEASQAAPFCKLASAPFTSTLTGLASRTVPRTTTGRPASTAPSAGTAISTCGAWRSTVTRRAFSEVLPAASVAASRKPCAPSRPRLTVVWKEPSLTATGRPSRVSRTSPSSSTCPATARVVSAVNSGQADCSRICGASESVRTETSARASLPAPSRATTASVASPPETGTRARHVHAPP